MDFEFTASVYVSNNDLNEMVAIAKRYFSSYDHTLIECVKMACEAVAAGWDDVDYFNYEYIAEKVEAEVMRRITEENETVS